jgi:hypothetical protein
MPQPRHSQPRSQRLAAAIAAIALAPTQAACPVQPQVTTLEISTGGESDALSRTPAPASFVLDTLDPTGAVRHSSESPAGSRAFEVGEAPAGTFARFRFTALGEQRQELVRGVTLRHTLGEQSRVKVFVSRLGEFARLPSNDASTGTLRHAGFAGPHELLFNRYFVTSAGETTSLYDFLSFEQVAAGFKLPFAAQSLLATGPYLFSIGASDLLGIVSIEPQNGRVEKRLAPGPVRDVAGVDATHTKSGPSYLVGATGASDTKTQAVWRFSRDGRTIALQSLATARAHAVVAAVGPQSVFVLSEDAVPELIDNELSRPLAFASNKERPVAAAGQEDGRHVVVVFQTGTVLRYDALCTASCEPERWPSRARASRGSAANIQGQVLFVGPDDASLLTATSAEQITPRTRRADPKLFFLPTSGIGLFGNNAPLETFLPR